MIVFGEDVAKKGGVYHATDGLQAAFGKDRVFDTLLDEQSILGLAIGAGHVGLLPVPEIQYLAYFHNAEDQIRGEAGSLAVLLEGPVPEPDGRPHRRRSATRRASAATSTTTTASPRCATFRAS